MTNFEKYHASGGCLARFVKICVKCEKVDCDRHYAFNCFNTWMDDEAEEEAEDEKQV